jgi:hypothetical protein
MNSHEGHGTFDGVAVPPMRVNDSRGISRRGLLAGSALLGGLFVPSLASPAQADGAAATRVAAVPMTGSKQGVAGATEVGAVATEGSDDAWLAATVGEPLTSTKLRATYAPVTAGALGLFSARKAVVKHAKGGIIGTAGKGVVAWRVDHMLDQFRSTTWPILRDRGMPAGLGVVTSAVGHTATDTIETSATTWAQLLAAHWEGNEIWAHSATHLDPAPFGTTGGLSLVDEIVTPRALLEAKGLTVMGWQQPGITGCTTPDYSSLFTNVSQFGSEVGRLLMGTYGLIEIGQQITGGQPRNLPTDGVLGYAHAVTVESTTLALCKTYVDLAVKRGVGVELMHHPKYIGQPGMMTVADFTALADYVVAKRDAGLIEVLTPSGLAFAAPSSTNRLNLLVDSDFEGLAFVGNVLGGWSSSNAAAMTLRTDGGHSGASFVRLTPSGNYLSQEYTYAATAGVQGAAFEATAWARAGAAGATSGAATIRAYLMDNSGATPLFVRDVRITIPAGGAWTKVHVPFCIPVTCSNLLIRVSRWGDANLGDLDIDEVKIVAV